MPAPKEIKAAKQLLVEGRTPEVFVQALLAALNVSGVQVQNYGGINDLASFLGALRRQPGFAPTVGSLGIIRDAEADAPATLQSVHGALRRAQLPLPARRRSGGPSAALRVTIHILPDGSSPGMLETLCMRSVDLELAGTCVERYLDCLRDVTGSVPAPREKAWVQAYLASRDRPGMLVGDAARAGYWPWDHAAFDELRAFLRSL